MRVPDELSLLRLACSCSPRTPTVALELARPTPTYDGTDLASHRRHTDPGTGIASAD